MKKVVIPVLILLLLSFSVAAAKSMVATRLIMTQDVNDNLMIAGQDLTLSNHIKGDLLCASGQVVLDGTVDGDVECIAGMLILNKDVLGDVRVTGGNVDIGGKISGDLVIFGGNVRIHNNAVIGKDLIIYGGKVIYQGSTTENIDIRGGSIVFNGMAGKNVFVEGKTISLEGGYVGGNLTTGTYTNIDTSKVTVKGTIFKKVLPARVVTYRSSIPMRIMAFLALFVIGAIIMLVGMKYTRAVARKVSSLWKSIGLGVLLLILVPIAAILLLITIIGIPLAVIIMLIYLIMIYLAKLAIAYWLVDRMGTETRLWSILALALSLFIIYAVISIPYAGPIINVLLIMTGFGAMVLAFFELTHPAKKRA